MESKVIVGQSIGLLISTSIADIFTAQSFSFVLILSLMLFGEIHACVRIARLLWKNKFGLFCEGVFLAFFIVPRTSCSLNGVLATRFSWMVV